MIQNIYELISILWVVAWLWLCRSFPKSKKKLHIDSLFCVHLFTTKQKHNKNYNFFQSQNKLNWSATTEKPVRKCMVVTECWTRICTTTKDSAFKITKLLSLLYIMFMQHTRHTVPFLFKHTSYLSWQKHCLSLCCLLQNSAIQNLGFNSLNC